MSESGRGWDPGPLTASAGWEAHALVLLAARHAHSRNADSRDFAGWQQSGPALAVAKTGAELDKPWWSSPASIRGPSAFQADALPTELLDLG